MNYSLINQSKKRKMFKIGKGQVMLNDIMGELPSTKECIKLISPEGGFNSINLIKYICENETIQELSCMTLRIGKKESMHLKYLADVGKIKKANFVIGSIMKEDDKKYRYWEVFRENAVEKGWKFTIVNNHAKIILAKTNNNYYCIETSSNLNQNPKIEQFNIENDEKVYDFYMQIFKELIN